MSDRICADSINPQGYRMTTFVVDFPKCLLAELNTHRSLDMTCLVRNVGSSRAVPTAKMIERVYDDPFFPIPNKNQRGMQGDLDVDDDWAWEVKVAWAQGIDHAITTARHLAELGAHKQIANRPLDTYLKVPVLISGTGRWWQHFFSLRNHGDAQPDFQVIAAKMQALYEASTPQKLEFGQWHIPKFENTEDYEYGSFFEQIQVAIARNARISYLSHDGEFSKEKDIGLFEKLNTDPPHASPFEHCAKALPTCKGFELWGQIAGLIGVEKRTPYFLELGSQTVYSRQFEGFYTARAHLEDGVPIE